MRLGMVTLIPGVSSTSGQEITEPHPWHRVREAPLPLPESGGHQWRGVGLAVTSRSSEQSCDLLDWDSCPEGDLHSIASSTMPVIYRRALPWPGRTRNTSAVSETKKAELNAHDTRYPAVFSNEPN